MELGVTRKTITRWADDNSKVPAGAWRDLARLLAERAAELHRLADDLDRAA